MLGRLGIPSAVGWWMLVASAVMFGAAVLAVPYLVTRLPVDYFAHPHRAGASYPRRYRWLRWLWLIAKNILGAVFLFFGVLMLLLPGQGILTILFAFALLDFPGKFRMQRWVVMRKGVLESINWIRARADKPPLVLEVEIEERIVEPSKS